MYTYLSSIALPNSQGAQWISVNLTDVTLYDIYRLYNRVYLTLSHPASTNPLYVDMEPLRRDYGFYQGSLSNWFIEIADMTLPFVAEIPTTFVKYVRYSDAIRAGYQLDKAIPGVNVPYYYPKTDQVTLIIQKPGIDHKLLSDYCLITVDGLLHRTSADKDRCYIFEGMQASRYSTANHVGILSFRDIGKVEQIPILPSQLTGHQEDPDLRTRAFIAIDRNLEGKTVLLSLGGYLVLPQENVFWRAGDRRYAVNTEVLPILERIIESRRILDLSALDLTLDPTNVDRINYHQTLSDAVLQKYFLLSQSFIILIDTPTLYIQKHFPETISQWPNSFIAYTKPNYPLMAGFGHMPEYWSVQEDNQWLITVEDSHLRNYTFKGIPGYLRGTVNGHRVPEHPAEHGRAFFLEMKSVITERNQKVITPYVVNPNNTSIHIGTVVTASSSPFETIGSNDSHDVSHWQLAYDPDFTQIVHQTVDDPVNLRVWPLGSLEENTLYYLRVRYRGTLLAYSDWSKTNCFLVRLTDVPITVAGPGSLLVNTIGEYVITDYDPSLPYNVEAILGTVVRNGPNISYTAPGVPGWYGFKVNGRQTQVMVLPGNVMTPYILSPDNGAIKLGKRPEVIASEFITRGYLDDHTSTDWELARDPEFLVLAQQSYQDRINLESWSLEALVENTVYYLRVRYYGDDIGYSEWSTTTTFTTGSTFTTPVISGPAALIRTTTGIYFIDNYSATAQYEVTAAFGTVSVDGNIITYIAPDFVGEAGFTVNGEVTVAVAITTAIAKAPYVISPINGAIRLGPDVVIDGSDLEVIGGTDTVVQGEWLLSTSPYFNDPADLSTITSGSLYYRWSVALLQNSLYYVKFRYLTTNLGYTEWSPVSTFSTKESYIAPTITGPASLTVNTSADYVISNYTEGTIYTVLPISGTVTVVGDTISYTAPAFVQPGGFTINGLGFSVTITPAYIQTPSLIYPANNDSDIGPSVIIHSSDFTSSGINDRHLSSDWILAKDPTFSQVVAMTNQSSIELTAWQVNGLIENNTYYIKVRYHGESIPQSNWSSTSSFQTQVAFPTSEVYTVTGPSSLVVNESGDYILINYDPNVNYIITPLAGTVSRLNDVITYTAPSTTGTYGFNVNGHVVYIEVTPLTVQTPTIIDPPNDQIDMEQYVTITASAFTVFGGGDSHLSTNWQLSTDQFFTQLVMNVIDDNVNLTSIATPALVENTQYYARVSYKSQNSGQSFWSATSTFTTQAYFITPDKFVTAGPSSLYTNQSAIYTLTNYDPAVVYLVATTHGSVSISGDSITYTAPDTIGTYGFTITAEHSRYSVNHGVDVIQGITTMPTITAPTDGAINQDATVAVVTSAFSSSYPGDSHDYTDWQVSTDPAFTTLSHQSLNDQVNLTTWSLTNLDINTTYYIRVRHKGLYSSLSDWSPVSSMTTKPSFITPVITGQNPIYVDQSQHYIITNYDSNVAYTVSTTYGTVSISGDTVTYQPGPNPGMGGFDIIGTKFDITVLDTVVSKPSITSPGGGQVNVQPTLTVAASAFGSTNPLDGHYSSSWEIATDSNFTTIVRSAYASLTELTQWTPTVLDYYTDYYVRVQYQGSHSLKTSAWSLVGQFRTRAVTPEVNGPTSLTVNTTDNYSITNYDAGITYDLAALGGSVSRSGNIITYTAPSTTGGGGFQVNDLTVNVTITPAYIQQPSINNPSPGSVMNFSFTAISNVFTTVGEADSHQASSWEISTLDDSTFSAPVITSYNSTTNLTSWDVTGLSPSTQYRIRVKYFGTVITESAWSGAVGFATVSNYADPGLYFTGYNRDLQFTKTGQASVSLMTKTNSLNWISLAGGTDAHGYFFTIAIKADGTLWAAGSNMDGLFQSPSGLQTLTVMTQIGTDYNWRKVFFQNHAVFAIKADGSLWGWGDNSSGVLGNNNLGYQITPIQVGTFTDWDQVSFGKTHNLGLRAGTLWSWGSPDAAGRGLGGTGKPYGPTQIGTDSDWVWVAAGYQASAAIKADGSLWTWGYTEKGQLGNAVAGISSVNVPTLVAAGPWKAVCFGRNHTLAIKQDGSLWGCGENVYGEIGTITAGVDGNGTLNLIANGSWDQISGGWSTSFMLDSVGYLFAMGRNLDATANLYGLLGDGTTTNQNSPTPILPDFITFYLPQIATNSPDFSMVLAIPRYPVVSGPALIYINQVVYFQITNYDPAITYTVTPYSGGNAVLNGDIVTYTAPASAQPGGFIINGTPIEFTISGYVVSKPSILYPVGINTNYEFQAIGSEFLTPGTSDLHITTTWEVTYSSDPTFLNPIETIIINTGSQVESETASMVSTLITGLSAASDYYIRVKYTGQTLGDSVWSEKVSFSTIDNYAESGLYAIGDNSTGAFGNGTTVGNSNWEIVGYGNWMSTITVATIYNEKYSLSVNSDHTLWGAGRASYGAFGTGVSGAVVFATWSRLGTDSDWVKIDTSNNSSLSIKTDKSLWAWGRNTLGVLGLGDTTERDSPTQVGLGTDWDMISMGYDHVLAIRGGQLWAWGDNSFGQLGSGDNLASYVPVQIGTNSDWVHISAGKYFSVGIRLDGSLWTWGSASNGQLANGSTTGTVLSPTQVGAAQWLLAVAAIGDLVCIRNDGSLWGAGANSYNEFSGSQGTNLATLVLIDSGLWSNLSLAESTIHAIKSDGTLWAIGRNNAFDNIGYGLFGDGTNTNRTVLTQVFSGHFGAVLPRHHGVYHSTALTMLVKPRTPVISGPDVVAINQIRTYLLENYDYRQTYTITPISGAISRTGNIITYTAPGTTGVGGFSINGVQFPITITTLSTQDPAFYYPTDGDNYVNYDFTITLSKYISITTGDSHQSTSWQITLASDPGFASPVLDVSYDTNSLSERKIRGLSVGQAYLLRARYTGSIYGDSAWSPAIQITIVDNYLNVGLWLWGSNSHYQFGNGLTTPSNLPVLVRTGGWLGFYENYFGAYIGCLAIKGDGTLWASGYSYNGSLGVGTTLATLFQSWTQIAVDEDKATNDWIDIACTNYGYTALKQDGSVWTAGQYYKPYLTRLSQLSGFTKVRSGYSHYALLKADGTLWGFGSNLSYQMAGLNYGNYWTNIYQLGTDTDWIDIACTNDGVIALKANGDLYACGNNIYGELGTGTSGTGVYLTAMTKIGNYKWKSLSSSYRHSLAIRDDYSLWGWGLSSYGELGDTLQHNIPTLIDGGYWREVAAGPNSSMAISIDGKLYSWGYGSGGQIGNGTSITTNPTLTLIFSGQVGGLLPQGGRTDVSFLTKGLIVPDRKPTLSGPTEVYTNQISTFYITNYDSELTYSVSAISGSVGITGRVITYTSPLTPQAGGFTINGYSYNFTIVDPYLMTPVIVHPSANQTGLNYDFYAVATLYTAKGVVDPCLSVTWEFTDSTDTGFATILKTVVKTNPVVPAITTILGLTPGTSYRCRVKYTGQSLGDSAWSDSVIFSVIDNYEVPGVYMCGSNLNSVFGDGTTTSSSSFVMVNSGDFVDVQIGNPTGYAYAIALKADGSLLAAGKGGSGVFADNVLTDETFSTWTPIVTDKRFYLTSTNNNRVIGISIDNIVYGWGDNSYSSLGLNNTTNQSLPVLISESADWSDIDVGSTYVIALRTGTLWLWGYGSQNEFGLGGSITQYNYPTQYETDSNWNSIGVCYSGTVTLKAGTELHGCGAGTYGQYGDGHTSYGLLYLRDKTSFNKFLKVSPGYGHILGIGLDGSLWGCGIDSSNELGGVAYPGNTYKFKLIDAGPWVSVWGSRNSSYALKADGTLWAWGYNIANSNGSYGILGNGSNNNVSWPPAPVLSGKAGAFKRQHHYNDSNMPTTTSFVVRPMTAAVIGLDQVYINNPVRYYIANYDIYHEYTVTTTNGTVTIEKEWITYTATTVGSGGFTIDGSDIVITVNNPEVIAPTILYPLDGDTTVNYDFTLLTAPGTIGGATDTILSLSYEITSSADTTFSTPLVTGTVSGVERYSARITGLTAATDYLIRAKITGAGLGDSAWSPTVAITTVDNYAAQGLYFTGTNAYNQFGDGNGTASNVVAFTLKDPGNYQAAIVVCESNNYISTLVIKSDGTLWGAGQSNIGILANGNLIQNYSTWTQIGTDTDWKRISCRHNTVIALKTTGSIWSWGGGSTNVLGTGSTANTATPIQIGTDSDWEYITTGYDCAFGIKSNGSLWSWGNAGSRLGLGGTNASVPTQVGTDTDWYYISSGAYVSIALKTDGSIYGCGYDTYSSLGLGIVNDNTYYNTFFKLHNTKYIKVSCGYYGVIAITSEGHLYKWGPKHNFWAFYHTPLLVSNDVWSHVVADTYTRHIIRKNGALWTWGDGSQGILGDGSNTSQNDPVITMTGLAGMVMQEESLNSASYTRVAFVPGH